MGLSYIGPVSGYLSQKSTLRSEEIGLIALQGRRTELSAQLAELRQPAVLETRAREIGMLRAGEQGFVIDFVSPRPAAALAGAGRELLHKLPGAS